ncbi:hypothetical protein N9A45_01190 [bacterium]|nr:hypothetical protein [bacterium]
MQSLPRMTQVRPTFPLYHVEQHGTHENKDECNDEWRERNKFQTRPEKAQQQCSQHTDT